MQSPIQAFFKRALDIFISLTALVLLAPVFLLVWLLVLLTMGRPVFFLQKRPGLHGKLFTFYKFRSMSNERGPDGELLPGLQRLTRWGLLLRKTSFDELPQLWNVLKGDMSLVGPRPLLEKYLDRYTPEQFRRHDVRPGVTGWAQVNGRNTVGWERRFEYDVWYVDHWSLLLDLKIIFLTMLKVITRDGVGFEPEFEGSAGAAAKSEVAP